MGSDEQQIAPVVNRNKLHEIANSVVPGERFDFDTETILMQFTDEFVDDLLNNACKLTMHRDSTTLEASDLLLYLERDHDITVAGYENLEDKVVHKSAGGQHTTSAAGGNPVATDEHSRRLAQIQRASNSIAHSSSMGHPNYYPSNASSMQFPGQSPFFPGGARR